MDSKRHGKIGRQMKALERLYRQWEASLLEHESWRAKSTSEHPYPEHLPVNLYNEIKSLRASLGLHSLSPYLLNHQYYIYDKLRDLKL